jgi:hypothetical protein
VAVAFVAVQRFCGGGIGFREYRGEGATNDFRRPLQTGPGCKFCEVPKIRVWSEVRWRHEFKLTSYFLGIGAHLNPWAGVVLTENEIPRSKNIERFSPTGSTSVYNLNPSNAFPFSIRPHHALLAESSTEAPVSPTSPQSTLTRRPCRNPASRSPISLARWLRVCGAR